jgi:hypothetical protein
VLDPQKNQWSWFYFLIFLNGSFFLPLQAQVQPSQVPFIPAQTPFVVEQIRQMSAQDYRMRILILNGFYKNQRTWIPFSPGSLPFQFRPSLIPRREFFVPPFSLPFPRRLEGGSSFSRDF